MDQFSACRGSAHRDRTAGTYTFTVKNQVSFPHNLTIEGPGVDKLASPTLTGGQSGSVAVSLQKGSYELWCSVDSHKDRGMDMRSPHRLLAFVVATGLGVDAYVHWRLAPGFDGIQGIASPHISQGELFRLESILALIAILLVLSRHRLGLVVAFLIAAGGLGAVLLYGYFDIGGFGPVPDMYDPIWYPEKTISAIAEGVAALGSLCLLWLPSLNSNAAT